MGNILSISNKNKAIKREKLYFNILIIKQLVLYVKMEIILLKVCQEGKYTKKYVRVYRMKL